MNFRVLNFMNTIIYLIPSICIFFLNRSMFTIKVTSFHALKMPTFRSINMPDKIYTIHMKTSSEKIYGQIFATYIISSICFVLLLTKDEMKVFM